MTRTIDFYFDFPSPYSYLAHTQLPRIAAEHAAAVAYHPFRILELMKIVGNRPTTIECRNKSKYAGADLQRWIGRYKVDFARTLEARAPPKASVRRLLLPRIAPCAEVIPLHASESSGLLGGFIFGTALLHRKCLSRIATNS